MGFKYNFIRDVDRQFLVSGGITYFIQEARAVLSPTLGMATSTSFSPAGKQIFDRGHWLSATGFRIPAQ